MNVILYYKFDGIRWGARKRRAAAESMAYDVEVYAHHAMVAYSFPRKSLFNILN